MILWQITAISDRETGNEPHLVYERFLLRGITLGGHELPKKENRLTVDSDAGVYCSRRPGIFPLWPNNIRAVVYPRYNFGESCSIIRAFTPKASIASSWIECDSMATQKSRSAAHEERNKALRAGFASPDAARKASPPTAATVEAKAKDLKLDHEVEEIPKSDGARVHWLGDRTARKVWVYLHGQSLLMY